jgi:cytosine/adenosine deaminase-related metal-dependent hydrolase
MPDATLDLLRRSEGDRHRRILVRGGYVLSMDARAGDFVGDLLIEGPSIAALGPGLADGAFDGIVIDAGGAIVIPGFVDSHLHGWQAALGGLLPDLTLPEYMATVHGAYFGPPGPPGLASCYEPEDMRIGNLGSSLRLLESGVTCFVDNCHNARTAAHSAAAIEGLREAGIRAVHAVGGPIDGTRTGWTDDALRLRDELSGGADELLTIRLFGVPDEGVWAFAREQGFWISSEAGGWAEADLVRLFDAGLMGPAQTFNHAAGFSEEMWRRIDDLGATVNVCARSDTSYLVEAATPPVAEALAHGVPVGISQDTEVGYSIDMFAEMRTLLHLARGRAAPLAPGAEPAPPLLGAGDVLRLATVGGAANADLADRVGSLVVGKAADLAVLRPRGELALDPPGNLVSTIVSHLTPADVQAVFVAGRVKKWDGGLVGIDLDRLRSQLADSRERILTAYGAALDPFAARLRRFTT